jgi:hypothetical protein
MRHLNMIFDGPQTRASRDAAMAASLAAFTSATAKQTPKMSTLRSPMINRVHFAKPGCSACGKKVM